MTERPALRTVLLHPVGVSSLVLLVVNDHVLKALFGNWLTGKLSDVAGVIVLPLLVVSIVDHLAHARRRPAPDLPRVLGPSIVLTGLLFSGVQLFDAVTGLYVDAIAAVWKPIVVTQDPTDLVALPALALAWWSAQRADRSCRRRPEDGFGPAVQRRRRASATRGSGNATRASSTG